MRTCRVTDRTQHSTIGVVFGRGQHARGIEGADFAVQVVVEVLGDHVRGLEQRGHSRGIVGKNLIAHRNCHRRGGPTLADQVVIGIVLGCRQDTVRTKDTNFAVLRVVEFLRNRVIGVANRNQAAAHETADQRRFAHVVNANGIDGPTWTDQGLDRTASGPPAGKAQVVSEPRAAREIPFVNVEGRSRTTGNNLDYISRACLRLPQKLGLACTAIEPNRVDVTVLEERRVITRGAATLAVLCADFQILSCGR